MSRAGLRRAVEILLEHRRATTSRFVDLAISLRICDVDTSGKEPVYVTATDEELIEVGGRWDRRAKAWAGNAHKVRILRVPRGSDQEQPARWVAEWMRRTSDGSKGAHWDVPTSIAGTGTRVSVEFRRAWTLMLVGGRRGGKSHLAIVAGAMLAALVPRSLIWAISPTQEETDELEQAFRAILPSRWYTARASGAGKTLQFKLVNGSRILFLSGHKPRTLKRGRVDLAIYNEAQNMTRAGWRQLRGAIADRGGVVVMPCNPPDAEIGRWIEDVFEQSRAGKIAVETFQLRGSGNPFVTREALEDMRREVDDVTARKEIDGEMGVPIGDVVMHAWSDVETVSDVPAHFVDVTAEETKKTFGRAFGFVVGMDFQATPHMAAVVYKLFRDPADPDAEILAWAVDEVVVDDADENDLVDALETLPRWTRGARAEGDGYRGWIVEGDDPAAPVHCCVVADASGWFQDGAHTKGRTSDKALRARKWTFLFKPQKDSDRNPEVMERVKATNTRLKTSGELGRRRLFSCRHLEHFNRAMRSWQNIKTTGQPNKRADEAHICDAGTYPIYRLFGRPRLRRGRSEYRSAGKRKRGDEMRNW